MKSLNDPIMLVSENSNFREMKIKTRLYDYQPNRMVITEKSNDTKQWQKCGVTVTLLQSW